VYSGNGKALAVFSMGVFGRRRAPPNAAEAHAVNFVAEDPVIADAALFRVQVGTGKRWGHVQRKWQNDRQICVSERRRAPSASSKCSRSSRDGFVAAGHDIADAALLRFQLGTGKIWGREQRKWQNDMQIC
jgi:hypothetical protein